MISCYTPFHIIAGFDLILVDELFEFHQTFSSSQLGDQFVRHSEEDANKSSPHREVVVLKVVPLWLVGDVSTSCGINNDHI